MTESTPAGLSAVLATPSPLVKSLRLLPQPTAPRESRDFVTRTLSGWGLDAFRYPACQVISELVTNSTVHAGTDIALSVAWSHEAVRLSVRDESPDLPRRESAHLGAHGRGLIIVASLSRVFGVLPTAQGGKVVWAVLDLTADMPREVATVPHVNQSELPTTVTRRGPDTEESSQMSPSFAQMAQKEYPDLSIDRGTP
ncbi:MAG: ATP-binding protein [Actinomycetota bacterium]